MMAEMVRGGGSGLPRMMDARGVGEVEVLCGVSDGGTGQKRPRALVHDCPSAKIALT